MEQRMIELRGEPKWAHEAIKGRKIVAIKIYRELFSVGLKAAKSAVEKYLEMAGSSEGRREWPWMVWLLEPVDQEGNMRAAEAYSRIHECTETDARKRLQDFVHNNFSWRRQPEAERAGDSQPATTAGKLGDLRAVFQKG